MDKYKCDECGYNGDYLVPVSCPICGEKFEGIEPRDIESVEIKCPYCESINSYKGVEYYMDLKTCEYCGVNFEVKKRVRYFIK